MPTLEERIAKLEKIVGDWDSPPVLSTGGTPQELPNHRYDLKESDYQLHVAVDKLVTEVKALQSLPVMRAEKDLATGQWVLVYTPEGTQL